MIWTKIAHNWPEVAATIAEVLSGTDRAALAEIGPDRDAVVAHIAAQHDLTEAEAKATLEERILIRPRDEMRFAAE